MGPLPEDQRPGESARVVVSRLIAEPGEPVGSAHGSGVSLRVGRVVDATESVLLSADVLCWLGDPSPASLAACVIVGLGRRANAQSGVMRTYEVLPIGGARNGHGFQRFGRLKPAAHFCEPTSVALSDGAVMSVLSNEQIYQVNSTDGPSGAFLSMALFYQ